MGRLFSNFDEAWAAFLEREDALESFYERLPEDATATLNVWLLQPPAEVKAAAADLQRAFAHLDWITPTPAHFMHVTIGHGGRGSFAGIEPFEIAYRRVNCFDEAVIVEVEGDGPRRLAERQRDADLFLPHLTLGYVRRTGAAAEIRAALVPLRDSELGTQEVEEVLLCRVPVSGTTVLSAWTVIERVHLQR